MIGTIRKHSKWLWTIVIAATIITFLFWMNPGQNSGGGGGTQNLGSIDGHKVTMAEYVAARNESYIFHWLQYNQWPDRDPNFSQTDLRREIYVRLLLIQEAHKLGIRIGNDAVATAAKEILGSPGLVREFGLNGGSVPLNAFVSKILQPEGLTAGDFEDFVRHDLAINQLRQAVGLTGELITPQEIAAIYKRKHQERSSQILFFSASNYLAAVPATTADVDQFYTNYLAQYRLPKRVSVSYVAFAVTNFMADAKHTLTNLNDEVDALYNRYGTNAIPDAKTPAEAKAKIRELLLRQQALADAKQKADDFASKVFSMEPVTPENLATGAKKAGLAVKVTAPFSQEYGPQEFTAPDGFTKAAFGLTPDEPLAGPIVGPDAVYVIALAKQLPSTIPPLSQIRARVTQDYRFHEATLRARAAGTNFVVKLQIGLALKRSFSAVCAAAGFHPETLPPFSLSTQDLPKLGDRASLNDVKSAVFGTAIGRASNFETTDNGGFIVYVQSELPLDKAAMQANLPQFAATLRQQNQNAAFLNWLQRVGGPALQNVPITSGTSDDGGQ